MSLPPDSHQYQLGGSSAEDTGETAPEAVYVVVQQRPFQEVLFAKYTHQSQEATDLIENSRLRHWRFDAEQ